ncbi:MAG TPA: hypothetical protein VFN02_08810 [Ktedonobacteraceae bacterium]|nr:hypothetical protein [Ktedonobacteraceae bacterium]
MEDLYERRGIIMGALAIGTSLALLLLESNLYDLALRFPATLADFIAGNLHQVNPIFDAVIALLVVGVSIIGILRNLPKLQREPRVKDLQLAMATTAPLIVVGVVLIAIQSRSEN